jgi:hypothetical protein
MIQNNRGAGEFALAAEVLLRHHVCPEGSFRLLQMANDARKEQHDSRRPGIEIPLRKEAGLADFMFLDECQFVTITKAGRIWHWAKERLRVVKRKGILVWVKGLYPCQGSAVCIIVTRLPPELQFLTFLLRVETE